MKRGLIIMGMCLLMCFSVQSQTMNSEEISFEVITPHIKWANPYYQGKLKALVLVDSHSGKREIVEIAQRLELDVDTVKFLHTGEYGYVGDLSIMDLSAAKIRLKEKLKKDYDVILVSGLNWNEHFDEEIVGTIISKVQNGTGLFLIAPYNLRDDLETFASGGYSGVWADIEVAEEHFLTRGIPWELLPKVKQFLYKSTPPKENVILQLKDKPMCWYGELGKGKVLVLGSDVYVSPVTPKIARNWAHILPYFLDETKTPVNRSNEIINYRYWEFFYSFIAKGMLWVANKQPHIQIKNSEFSKQKTLEIVLESEKDERGLWLEAVLRNKFSENEQIIRRAIDVKKGENKLSIPVSDDNLFFNLTLVDIFLKNKDKKIITWGSTYIRTDELLYIKDVVFSETIIKADAPKIVKGLITLEGPVLDAVVPSEYSIEINAFDYYGRQISKDKKSFNDPTVAFQIVPLDLQTIPVKVEILLKKGNKVEDKKEQTILFLKERNWDTSQFHLISWYLSPFRGRSGRPYLNNFAYQRVFEFGVDAVYTHSNSEQYYNAIKNNIMFCPYAPASELVDKKFDEKSKLYKETKDKKYLIREPSFTDPEFRETAKKIVYETTKQSMLYGGAHDYVITDEFELSNGYYDFDFSPSSIKAFRDWLKKQYKTISELNKEWETDYKSWEEIEPLTLEEAKKRENGNYAPWADFRTFIDTTVAEFFAFLQKTSKEIDPFAKWSLSGTQTPRAGAGTDWWKLCNSLEFLHSYNPASTALIHLSFGKYTNTLVSPYYAAHEASMWWSAFYDAYGVSMWMTPRLLDPDLSYSAVGKVIKKTMDDFKSGLWKLLRVSNKEKPFIAIHYSHPTIQAFCVMGSDYIMVEEWLSWTNLLSDLGYQFDFVSYAQLEQPDFLNKNGYKILIIPQSMAISEKEASEIEKFVRSGGIVIGDSNIGLMNNHCRTLKEPYLLKNIFGLEMTKDSIKPMEFTLIQDLGDLKKGEILSLVPKHQLVSKSATPLLTSTSTGVLYINNYGQGKGIFLNLDISTYVHRRMMEAELLKQKHILSNMVKGVLTTLNFNPSVVIKPSDGNMFEGNVFLYTDGDTNYIGVVGNWISRTAKKATYQIVLPDSYYHIYDLKEHQYLGQNNLINMVLDPKEAKLYAITPAKLEPPSVTISKDSYSQGEIVKLKIFNQKIRKNHTPVYLEVFNPEGTKITYYSTPYFINPGQQETEGSFRFSLNDKQGTWTLKFTDLFTGSIITKQIILK